MPAKKKPKTPTKEHKVTLAAAQNPKTTADALTTLYDEAAQHYDKTQHRWVMETPDVLAALAQNPNTPPHLLARLVTNYAQAFCANPLAPLLSLETPTFWTNLRGDAVMNLMRFAAAPASGLQTFVGVNDYPADVSEAARLHIGIAGKIAPNAWPESVRDLCRAEARRMEAADRETVAGWTLNQLLADWVELGLVPADWCKPLPDPAPLYEPEFLVQNPSYIAALKKRKALPSDVSPNVLHDMVRQKDLRDSAITLAVALHPRTSPDTLRHLGQRRENNLGLAVVLHPNTPPDTLLHFAQGIYDEATPRRIVAARHKNADETVLRELAGDASPLVRRFARRHKNAPQKVTEISREAALTPYKTDITIKKEAPLWFVLYGLHQKADLAWLKKQADSLDYRLRLGAAFALHRRACERAKKGGKGRVSEGEALVRSLLQTDGNRLVHAVANAPATPTFDFAL